MDKRKRRRVLRRVLSSLLLVAVAVLIISGFMPNPVAVHPGVVVRRDLQVTVDESGKTRLRARHVLSAPVLGNLQRIVLRAGDTVEKGQVLARIAPVTSQLLDPRTRAEARARVLLSQANLARAQANEQRARAALDLSRQQALRMRQLHQQSGASKQALDQAEFEYRAAEQDLNAASFGAQVAENELTIARNVLTPTQSGSDLTSIAIPSPIRGRVLRVIADSEGVVQLGAPLLELGDPKELEVVVDVLTSEAVAIVPGAPARIERWGGEAALKAQVRSIEPSGFTTRSALGVEEQRVPVVLELLSQPNDYRGLSDGYRVEAHIQTRLIPKALLVPNSALFRDGENWKVFAMHGDEVRERPVMLGARTPDWVEVESGLRERDRVVLYPSDQVREGVKVRAVD